MRFAGVFLFLGVMVLGCSIANAGPSSHRIKQDGPSLLDLLAGDDDTDSSQATAPMDAEGYDGVWRGHGRLLLVKRIHRTLFLSGSSDTAAWQAQCVMSTATAKCLGSGISKTKGEFRYESDLHLDGTTLRGDWTLHYSNGQSDSGHGALKRAL